MSESILHAIKSPLNRLRAAIGYRGRWIFRSIMCRVQNRFPRVADPKNSYLIDIHQSQKNGFAAIEKSLFEPDTISELNEQSLATRIALLERNCTRALELGCDSGWFLETLLREHRISEGFGVDIRAEALVHHPFPGKALLNATADALPFKNRQFDLIVAFHVIEHVCDIDALRRELTRVSDTGAEVLIALPLGFDRDPCHRWHFMTQGGWKRFLKKRLGLDFVRGAVHTSNTTEFVGLFRIPD